MNANPTQQRNRSAWSRPRLLLVALAVMVLAAMGLSVLGGIRSGGALADPAPAVAEGSTVPATASPNGWLAAAISPAVQPAPVAIGPPVVLTAAKLDEVNKKAKSLAANPVSAKIVSRNQVLRLVRQYFPGDQVGNAMAVASCESGQLSVQGATNSNGTTDWGIFQLNDGGTLQSALAAIGRPAKDKRAAQVAAMDAATNVQAAAKIYSAGGWAPWVCAYKQQIVAGLWSNKPGPMAGKYSVIGVELPDAKQYRPTAKPAEPTKKPVKPVVAPAGPTGQPAAPGPTQQPSPSPDPTASATPEPSGSAKATAPADPGSSTPH